MTVILLKDLPCQETKGIVCCLQWIGHSLGNRLCNDITSSEGMFTVILDQTTTVQNKKDMGVLILYWNENEGLIVTQYLMSLSFGCATGKYIADLFLQSQQDENKPFTLRCLSHLAISRP